MKQEEVNELLKELEDSNLASSLSIDGFSCWVKIKNDLFSYLTQDSIAIGVRKGNFLNLFSIKFFFSNLFSLIKIFFLKSKKRVLFHTALSGLKSNSDIFTDYLSKGYKSEIYFINIGEIDKIKNNPHFFRDNIVFCDNLFLWPFKFLFANFLTFLLPGKINSSIRELVSILDSKGFDVKYNFFAKIIISYAVSYYFYKFLFKRMNISKSYLVSAYSKSDVCAALLKLGINVIEIQHGLVGVEHRGYNYSKKLSDLGNVKLPVPNIVMVTNEFWRCELLNAGFYRNSDILIGHNYKLDGINEKYKFYCGFYIFTGQGVEYEVIKNFYLRSLEFLKLSDFIILYKPHPREDKATVNEVLGNESHLKVYDGNESTETLIYHAISHISIYSSCHFDAVEMKGETFVLSSDLSSIMSRYINNYPEQFILINSLS